MFFFYKTQLLSYNQTKYNFFWQGSPGKICTAGAKYHVIGHEKQPMATVLK